MYTIHVKPVHGKSFSRPLAGEVLVIGRSRGSDIVLNDEAISRRHAQLVKVEGSWYIEDLNSRNGSLVNDVLVQRRTLLEEYSQVNLSGNTLYLTQDEAYPSDAKHPSGTVLLKVSDLLMPNQQGSISGTDEHSLRLVAGRLSLLNELHQALSKSVSSEDLLNLALEVIFEHLHPEVACIFLKGENGQLEMAARKTLPGVSMGNLYSQTLTREVAEGGLAAIVDDIATDQRFSASASMVNAGFRSLLAAPLLDHDGNLGMIVLASRMVVRRFSEEDLALLVAIASLAALRIRNLSLMEEVAQNLREANAVLERKVAERTAALEKSNLELRAKNEDILYRQNQLLLQEKMASVGTMAAGVAHLIKNPLNFVKNLSEVSADMVTELGDHLAEVELLLPGDRLQEIRGLLADLKTNAQIVHSHGVRADQIVVSLMDYAREPAKGDRRFTNLNALVEKYAQLALHGRLADSKNVIKLRHVHDPQIELVTIYPGDLSRTLIAMIHNAVEAILEKQRVSASFEGEIETTTRRLNGMVEITITDNGIGIRDEDAQHIFTPFFTTKRDENHIGLGLSISYDTVTQRHQGSLSVSSVVGSHTRFTLRLPTGVSPSTLP